MATCILKFTDQPDGGIEVSLTSDPPFTDEDETLAQRAAFVALEYSRACRSPRT